VDGSVEREFTAFVAERKHALLRVAFTLTGDQRAAEDLVQGALAKAFSRWRRIDDVEAYVRRIIYNDQMSVWRHGNRHRELPTEQVPEQATPDRHEHDTTLRMVLRDALLALPPRQRAVLVLRYLEDLDVQQTAKMLGCRPGTVASQTSRALEKLRESMPAMWELMESVEEAR
jgi:RNA polymerase sigma-70 factor (sigma-E family)